MKTKQRQPISDILAGMGACGEAIKWAKPYGDDRPEAWRQCPRGDWMLWYIGRQIKSAPWSDDRKPLLACALDCALTVEHLWPEKHRERIAAAVETLRRWIAGEVTAKQAYAAQTELWNVHAAAYAAYAAAAAYAADAAYAAYAAAYAAATATDATCASVVARAVACVAFAAAYAADDAEDAAEDARKTTLAECAAIVRKHYPVPPATEGVAEP